MRHTFTSKRLAVVGTILLTLATVTQTPAAVAGNSVTNITFDRPTPNILLNGDKVTVSYSYTTNSPGGVLIFVSPFAGTSMADIGSPALLSPTGSGTGTSFFSIQSGRVTITRVRIQMWSTGQRKLLFQAFLPVHYEFRAEFRDG